MPFERLYLRKQIYIYVGFTSVTLLTAQHLKKHSCPTTEFRKILTDNTILEQQNNNKDHRCLKSYTLEIKVLN